MKKIIIIIYILSSTIVFSQNKIDWDGKYQLKQSDFQSPATQIGNTNTINLTIGSSFEFLLTMSNFEFMFIKNFNSKVSNSFHPKSAVLVAPDVKSAECLIDFGQFQFNLSELYNGIVVKS